MKRSTKILVTLVVFILIGVVLLFANAILGNPVSKMMANNNAKEYIEKNYKDLDLVVEKVGYDFKTGGYYVNVKNPNSKDIYFTLTYNSFGRLINDFYENNVVNKWNTYQRINDEYFDKVKKVFEDKNFPYKVDIGFGNLKAMEDTENEYGHKYGIKLSDLEIDKKYDILDLGRKYGNIVCYVEDDNISIKRASEILLDIKSILDDKNITFYTIDFVLEKPRNENGERNPDDTSVEVKDFLYSDIYKSGLEDRIKEEEKNLKEYYKEQDDIKEQEIKE